MGQEPARSLHLTTTERISEKAAQTFYRWSDKYSFGIYELDEHQSEFFTLLNDLYSAITMKTISDDTRHIDERIIHYTAVQFTIEKNFIDKYHYPNREIHLEQHKNFKQKVYSYQERLRTKDLFVLLEIANFLRNWLGEHIAKEDRSLGAFLTGQSLPT